MYLHIRLLFYTSRQGEHLYFGSVCNDHNLNRRKHDTLHSPDFIAWEPRWIDTNADEQAVSTVIEGPLISK